MLETDDEENTQVIGDPDCFEETKEEQVDTEIAALRKKVKLGETSKYVIQEGKLYYLSGRDDQIRSKLYVPRGLILEIGTHGD